jgi:short-subunit dehydrogenase
MSRVAERRDRVVIVTGASSGIGAAAAIACGAEGMSVVLASRQESRLREVANQVEAVGGVPLVVPTDVRVPLQIDALVSATVERFGAIDVLLASAGLGCPVPVHRATATQIRDTVEVNLLGVMLCARAVLPQMLAQGRGHVITVTSVIVGLRWPDDSIYSSTKVGLHRFTSSLRHEVQGRGIHVTEVVPGVVDTAMTKDLRGWRKSSVEIVSRHIIEAIYRPRSVVVTPAWYRYLLVANRILPGVVDALIVSRSKEGMP